jgi:hypothetical protein
MRSGLMRSAMLAALGGALSCNSSGTGVSVSGGRSGTSSGTAGSTGGSTVGAAGGGGAGTACAAGGGAGTTGVAGTAGGGTGTGTGGAAGTGSGAAGHAGSSGLAGAGGGASYVWPNTTSFTNSDPWIEQHHDQIVQMNPNVLVLNYANKCGANDAVTCDPTEMQKLVQDHMNFGLPQALSN